MSMYINIAGLSFTDEKFQQAYLLTYTKDFVTRVDSVYFEGSTIRYYEIDTNMTKAVLFTRKRLPTTNSYRLVINDSIKFDMSDFVLKERHVMGGIRLQTMCLIDSMKINDRYFELDSSELWLPLEYAELNK